MLVYKLITLSNDSDDRFENPTRNTSPIYKSTDYVGIVMTVACYAVGLSSLATNRPKLGQRMMYSRIAFQGMTVATMFYSQWLDRKTKDSITHNNQHNNLKSSFLYPSIN